jgi:CRP/FNR family transcriptional regulator, anaerobic regulatory protein
MPAHVPPETAIPASAGSPDPRACEASIAVAHPVFRLESALAHVVDPEHSLVSIRPGSSAARRQVAILEATARRIEERDRSEPVSASSGTSEAPSKPEDFPCLSFGIDADAAEYLDRLLARRSRIKSRTAIYRIGENFHTLYVVRSGSCKTVLIGKAGQYYIAGFHIAGDIIGIDGIGSDVHECQATALEDMEVCPLPFDRIEYLARTSSTFGHNLHRVLAQESGRSHSLMLMLGTMRADKRLAVFLLDLSRRYQARGYSSREFVLRMTREEIGSHLGLKLETVSRLFSRFQHEGVVEVRARTVKLDLDALETLAEQDLEPGMRHGGSRDGCLQRAIALR